jgi:cellulose biosynthesis protein BcsS
MNRLLTGGVAAVLALAEMPANAADLPAPPANQAVDNQTSGERVQVTSGFDAATIKSYTGYVGGTFAPYADLDTSGLRFSVFGAAGAYQYPAAIGTANRVKGTYQLADFLVGYGFNKDGFSAKLQVGLDIQNHDLSPLDPNNPVHGTSIGPKVQGDFYANPTERSMLFGLASYTTVFRTYYSEFKAGYDFFSVKDLYLGPQVIAEGNERYDQWRVGAHLTGFKFGKGELGLSGGFLRDSQSGTGAYSMVTFDIAF